jgi:uncharacterized protein
METLRINNIKISLEKCAAFMSNGNIDDKMLRTVLADAVRKKISKVRLDKALIKRIDDIVKSVYTAKIIKESVDARKEISLIFSIEVSVKADLAKAFRNIPDFVKMDECDCISLDCYLAEYHKGIKSGSKRPIVVGFGPAGMFCAYMMSAAGLRPIIIERGKDVESRSEDVDIFWKSGELNEESNVQFGEGGAGTFSDGKLTSRSKDKRSSLVMDILHMHGAPKDVTYKSKPHVGTDLLKDVVKSIREFIISKGGEVRFGTRLENIHHENGKLEAVTVASGGTSMRLECDNLVVAIGHSARDTFRMLHDSGVEITRKPFAVGVRIEHPRTLIDDAQYKDNRAYPVLGAADYFLTHKCSNGRSAYTFCMCPGGEVVAASTRKGELVVNGMSYHARNLENSNSALLVNVNPDDFGSDGPLSGVIFQEEIERKAYELGGGGYIAPVQSVGDFLGKASSFKSSDDFNVIPSYSIGMRKADLSECLPDFVVAALREAIPGMARKLKGFDIESAILTGVETRTSSPVRIVRDENSLESVNIDGLYPCGEGAGYAGGIVSSAIDGIKVAESILSGM